VIAVVRRASFQNSPPKRGRASIVEIAFIG
jgi:hypothetical protein